jgi:hypothetical protein
MIFRAAFAIALVAILMPHEPDLGYGRPNDSGSLSAVICSNLQTRIVEVGTEIREARAARHDGGTAIVAAVEALTKHSLHTIHQARRAADPIGDRIAATMVAKTTDAIGDKIGKFALKAEDQLP